MVRLLDFGLEVSGNRERAVVRPSGEVDIATAAQLEAAVIECLNRGCAQVVVDLRAVTFLDSSGIRTLIAGHRRAQELKAGVTLIVGGGCARRALELAGVLDHLDLELAPVGAARSRNSVNGSDLQGFGWAGLACGKPDGKNRCDGFRPTAWADGGEAAQSWSRRR